MLPKPWDLPVCHALRRRLLKLGVAERDKMFSGCKPKCDYGLWNWKRHVVHHSHPLTQIIVSFLGKNLVKWSSCTSSLHRRIAFPSLGGIPVKLAKLIVIFQFRQAEVASHTNPLTRIVKMLG